VYDKSINSPPEGGCPDPIVRLVRLTGGVFVVCKTTSARRREGGIMNQANFLQSRGYGCTRAERDGVPGRPSGINESNGTLSFWSVRFPNTATDRVQHPRGNKGSPAETDHVVGKNILGVDSKHVISIVKTSGGSLESLRNKSGNLRDSCIEATLELARILKIESQPFGMLPLKKADTLEDTQ
jgi:hypothetical protein